MAPDEDWNKVKAASIEDEVGDQKFKRNTQGKFAAESSKSQEKPLSPFGEGDYPAYYEQKQKPSREWAEFERHQWGR